ncbi:uncharacterized protein EAE98_002273 [Botrytis deweyae]|uniref:Uncharacterized protein n=1 Tax=Botrytis deweyae TaxID=2478750 RepID=A0ABQ7IWQ9_9HELO|nr:uncharacterized protein EAE98_002273 [Botrytis deweyae]KAF7936054.1 hypothetical protein EAE98_002273 [Botrytis deweyae]
MWGVWMIQEVSIFTNAEEEEELGDETVKMNGRQADAVTRHNGNAEGSQISATPRRIHSTMFHTWNM